jgi:hypothetical protein
MRLILLAHPTRFEHVTFAFGGQRFETECLGPVRPQILLRLILRGGLLFIWKQLPTYWNCLSGFSAFFPNAP